MLRTWLLLAGHPKTMSGQFALAHPPPTMSNLLNSDLQLPPNPIPSFTLNQYPCHSYKERRATHLTKQKPPAIASSLHLTPFIIPVIPTQALIPSPLAWDPQGPSFSGTHSFICILLSEAPTLTSTVLPLTATPAKPLFFSSHQLILVNSPFSPLSLLLI